MICSWVVRAPQKQETWFQFPAYFWCSGCLSNNLPFQVSYIIFTSCTFLKSVPTTLLLSYIAFSAFPSLFIISCCCHFLLTILSRLSKLDSTNTYSILSSTIHLKLTGQSVQAEYMCCPALLQRGCQPNVVSTVNSILSRSLVISQRNWSWKEDSSLWWLITTH